MATNRFTHAALNPIAFMCLAQHLARCEPNARNHTLIMRAFRCWTRCQKPRHGCGELLPGALVHTLIIGMLAQPWVARGKQHVDCHSRTCRIMRYKRRMGARCHHWHHLPTEAMWRVPQVAKRPDRSCRRLCTSGCGDGLAKRETSRGIRR